MDKRILQPSDNADRCPEIEADSLQRITEHAQEEQSSQLLQEAKVHVKEFFDKYGCQVKSAAERGETRIRIEEYLAGPSTIHVVFSARGFKVFWSDEDDLPRKYVIIEWK